MLVVITVVAVIAGVVITQFDSSAHDKLVGTAQVVAADIAHVRNLAVTNNSTYKVAFDRANNSYSIAHSGTNGALDILPQSAFHSTAASPTEHVTNLATLPLSSGGITLAIVETSDSYESGYGESVTDVEFGPLGETTRTQGTTIWLSAGVGSDRTFVSVNVDPVTGLAGVGSITATVPHSLEEEEAASQEEESYNEESYYDEGYGESEGSSSSSDESSSSSYSEYEYSDPSFSDPATSDPSYSY